MGRKVGKQFNLILNPDIDALMCDIPSGKKTQFIEDCIKLYFNGDIGRIEESYKEATDKKDRAVAEYLMWKDRYDRARAEEDIKLKRVLTEWGYTRSHPPPFKNQDMTEPFPLLMQFGIKRTRREVLEFLEGME